MKTAIPFSILFLLGTFVAVTARAQTTPAPSANPSPPPSAPAQKSAAEIEKLIAPIALYPDPLIATILPASVYPLEIVQAARFVRDTNNLAKLDQQPWDENVKAVARVPEVIKKMNDDLSWTTDLGLVFLAQQQQVMETVQSLRAKAQKVGTLQTTPQQIVTVTNMIVEKTVEQKVVVVTNTIVQIQPSNPQVVYVPSYNPVYVYAPPPGPPPIVTFAAGVAVGAIIANNCDWHGGGVYVGHHGVAVWGSGGGHGDVDVDIDVNRNTTINTGNINTGNINSGNRPQAQAGATAAPQKWQPNQSRLQSSGAPGSAQSYASKGWSNPSATRSASAAGSSAATVRPSASPSAGQSVSGRADRPAPAAAPASAKTSPSPTPQSSARTPAPAGSSAREGAFSGTSKGSHDKSASSRGKASRGGSASGRSGGGRR